MQKKKKIARSKIALSSNKLVVGSRNDVIYCAWCSVQSCDTFIYICIHTKWSWVILHATDRMTGNERASTIKRPTKYSCISLFLIVASVTYNRVCVCVWCTCCCVMWYMTDAEYYLICATAQSISFRTHAHKYKKAHINITTTHALHGVQRWHEIVKHSPHTD